ncbi:MAG: hypothetical protein ACSHX8_04020 [Opitutaceae bacterium]
MPDYYIRTPDQDTSRGPFDPIKLQSLAEAGQITKDSLYYDESKEEWIPIALNKELLAEVFPQREKLALHTTKNKKKKDKELAKRDPGGLNVEEMLDAADGNTKQRRSATQAEKSLRFCASVSAPATAIMMLASAMFLLYPHEEVLTNLFSTGTYLTLLNFPFIIIGFIDFIVGLCLFLSVTSVYPFLRFRSMLTLGFGVYVGWSLNDPILILASAMAGLGIFLATLTKRSSLMILAIACGIGGSGYLVYLAGIGRLTGFFEGCVFELF